MLLATLRIRQGVKLFWSVVPQLLALLVDLTTARRWPDGEKDLEILLLRHQLRVLERRQPRPCLSRWERLTLALLMNRLRRPAAEARQRWSRSLVLVTPATVLRGHRERVRRTWTFRGRRQAGRRRIDTTLEALIVRLARENPRWGYGKVQGELAAPRLALDDQARPARAPAAARTRARPERLAVVPGAVS